MTRAQFPMVVHVLLQRRVPDPEVFLLRRAGTGFMDGYFALPGGHVEAGELPSEAACRECLEETGVRPLDLQPLCAMPYRSGRHIGTNLVFVAAVFDGTPTLAEPLAADLALWAPQTSLPEPRAPWIASVLGMQGSADWYAEFDSS
ncbi:MAG: NUDIX domain-containing protein [Pseudomonadales bacterium]